MFEVTGGDIVGLSDADLRTLVARLAIAELRAQGCPISSVTAGGTQDAPDGGLDVVVDCPTPLPLPDFVPRALTGFQVKKPDMPKGAIEGEMRPRGLLRPAIADLIERGGGYIIVSAQGSVANRPLIERRAAIRAQVADHPACGDLHSDFYDRDRLASWTNQYPGVAAWVRSRIGRGLAGWSGVGDWAGTRVGEEAYLVDDLACLVDERTAQRETLTLAVGVGRLRAALSTPRTCVRLVGLSGLGKTRLVKALFESDVGTDPLDPSLAVYTDYSVETDPAARDMARRLVVEGRRAILIVDNCNPATHNELARICAEPASPVSLLTVEYDVSDDEPEFTEVFRLQAPSPDLVSRWLQANFPDVSEVDRKAIAAFSGGNFRIGRALAETLDRGESLGRLASRDLFERIFRQRNAPDRDLLFDAEDIALLYSIDGEDTAPTGELARIGALRGISADRLYTALAELRRRGVVQARGRWRAILPQAIANWLAASALMRSSPATLDRVCATLTPRMQTSLSRRVGYLHDTPAAQAAVARWRDPAGSFGDLFDRGDEGRRIFANIAPVAPAAALERIERQITAAGASVMLAADAPGRSDWIRLIRSLAYDADLFERAITALARFLAAEGPGRTAESARESFSALFQIHLSGAKATPCQRRDVVRRLALASDSTLHACAPVALDALLQADYFSSSSDPSFGARPRDWGWRPRINRDIRDWFEGAIALAMELDPVLPEARACLARHVRSLWRFAACRDAIEQAADAFASESPWIEGWLNLRSTLRFDGAAMSSPDRARLGALIARLAPPDLLHQARAVVFGAQVGGYDLTDGDPGHDEPINAWTRASAHAREIGRQLARDPQTRADFLEDLLRHREAYRGYECGVGLAEGGNDPSALWAELVDRYGGADPALRNVNPLGGFIASVAERDIGSARRMLDHALENPVLAPALPYLQGRAGVDEDGVGRLRRGLQQGHLQPGDFYSLANGVVRDTPPAALASLLRDVALKLGGVEIATDILYMHVARLGQDAAAVDPVAIELGRELLAQVDFRKRGPLRDAAHGRLISLCCADTTGEATARTVGARLRHALSTAYILASQVNLSISALFTAQPMVALDTLLLTPAVAQAGGRVRLDLGEDGAMLNVGAGTLELWAAPDPTVRWPLLGQVVTMFRRDPGAEDNRISPFFLEVLGRAHDKGAFLGDMLDRLQPRGWSGSLADILTLRRGELVKLKEGAHPDVQSWVEKGLPELDRWISHARDKDRDVEQSFE